MVKRRSRRARGMTLVEVMIALLVTTVALLGALATVGVTVRGSSFSRSSTEASELAQSKLEQLVSLQTGSTTGTLPAGGPPETGLNAYGTTAPPGPYTRTTIWTTINNGQQRQVTVEVDWPDLINPAKNHSVYATRTQDLQ